LTFKPFFFQAQVFKGELPKTDISIHHGDKLHQVFTNTRTTLEHILAGYCLPEPYFKNHLQSTVDTLMKCLRDPALPLFELQVRSFSSLAV
jgi:acetyl-CoA carboxylase / biotin carboxylase 1